MTGDVLRRLRKAYGFSAKDVANAAGRRYARAVRDVERTKSFVGGSVGRNNQRRRMWLWVVDALRRLRDGEYEVDREAAEAAEPAPVPAPVVVRAFPKGTTHLLQGEPVRVVDYHGRRMGFAWDGEWVRANRVELSRSLEVVQ